MLRTVCLLLFDLFDPLRTPCSSFRLGCGHLWTELLLEFCESSLFFFERQIIRDSEIC